MSKKLLFIFIAILAAAISCAVLKRSEVKKAGDIETPHRSTTDERLDLKKDDPDNFMPEEPINEPGETKKKGIDMGDLNTAECDDMVREQAKKWGKDPAKLRLLIRQGADGVRIYRELGMFIIVGADGEEVFIPDEF